MVRFYCVSGRHGRPVGVLYLLCIIIRHYNYVLQTVSCIRLLMNNGSCLKTGQHSIFVIIKKNTRMLDTLFINDFIDTMEQYFHYYNHNWQCNSVAQTKDLHSCDSAYINESKIFHLRHSLHIIIAVVYIFICLMKLRR